jgi:hypothetical protein
MSFSAFSSFLHKLAFQRSKSQLKNLLFVPDFDFSAFQLKKTAEKQEQTGPKRTEGWDSRRHEGGGVYQCSVGCFISAQSLLPYMALPLWQKKLVCSYGA